ncbi:hypothetical protein J9332_43535, partial [Aquimarina celericrescens]|nr:hypothetical protein [Aquimarina celericrescens]
VTSLSIQPAEFKKTVVGQQHLVEKIKTYCAFHRFIPTQITFLIRFTSCERPILSFVSPDGFLSNSPQMMHRRRANGIANLGGG